ncbi:MAG: response regulator transcription factor [Dehalococcoides mccartyi]|uniref:response regulator transcription factor n=1 Tax=Dehalococcoides TaxID=61434 RepID=UPI002737E306|nr:response regulator transcription factor [Dehalococcoides mccartyi]MDP4280499.1 response regulator transcription factor [Dehalococcoides mccartyi]
MIEPKSALIIEDNEDIVQAVSLAFQIRWPNITIFSTASGEKGVLKVEDNNPSFVIVDLNLPDINGFEVIKEIRAFSRVPVIVLSVRSSEADIVRALELGADDYVLKPFHQLELTSRVNAQLRHGEAGEGECLVLGDYSLDLAERVLSVDNQSISLTRIESIVLETLFNRAGHVVSHTTLAEQIWGDTHPSTVRNVRIHIKRLRNKLEKEGGIIYLIQTKPGVGYSVQTKPLAPPNLSILKDVNTDSCHQSFPF